MGESREKEARGGEEGAYEEKRQLLLLRGKVSHRGGQWEARKKRLDSSRVEEKIRADKGYLVKRELRALRPFHRPPQFAGFYIYKCALLY